MRFRTKSLVIYYLARIRKDFLAVESVVVIEVEEPALGPV
jgi:hypothetical protein